MKSRTIGDKNIYMGRERTSSLLPSSKKELVDGCKYDQGKPQYGLIPFRLLEGVARVREYGVKKYKDSESWKKIPDAKRRYTDALLRHLFAWQAGEDIDPESGLKHIDHMLCNAIFLRQFEETT